MSGYKPHGEVPPKLVVKTLLSLLFTNQGKESMNIFVKSEDLGFWTQTLVPVQKYDGEEMIYCNHDGAKEEENVQDFWNPITSEHITRTDWVLVCKCGAYRFESDDEWNDASFEGAR